MGSIPEENTNTNTRGHTVKQLILLSRTTGVPPVVQNTHTPHKTICTDNTQTKQQTISCGVLMGRQLDEQEAVKVQVLLLGNSDGEVRECRNNSWP